MSKKGTKRKADFDLNSDGSDGLFVKDSTPKDSTAKGKKPASNSKKRRLSRLEEYDEDKGRDGSRGFQKWAKIFNDTTATEVKASKAFLKDYKAKVKKHGEQMRDFIQQQEQTLTEVRERNAAIFDKLYSAAVPHAGAGSTDKEGHVLFAEAQSVFSKSSTLVRQFKKTDERLEKDQLELPVDQWKQDKKILAEVLALGRKQGEELIEGVLAPDAYPTPKQDEKRMSEAEQMACEMFNGSRKALEGSNWGTAAAVQVKLYKALAMTVSPSKEPERS
ncbi:Uu.00g067090.m01.CDS01 [Anthostomella pinea]|uniref:Uu.00g067090.m01.CDS01 n=1 Tax=Anthostomella pinea TaxID=933095 RepID=A0AAI8VUW1_9PEZI|nr:Uu.00g067090.m01.CDS01 [Anthostomella pinea]